MFLGMFEYDDICYYSCNLIVEKCLLSKILIIVVIRFIIFTVLINMHSKISHLSVLFTHISCLKE